MIRSDTAKAREAGSEAGRIERLKTNAARGGMAKLCGQAGNFALRMLFIMVLARLLSPQDFGLVAMVTTVTGIYELFTSAGLSAATVQRSTITHQQISTLFWVNILVGAALAVICIASAPFLVKFYHEPRLFWVTVVMGAGFLINALGIQHSALLQRDMRYVSITAIELCAQMFSMSVGIGMALAGYGYWALIGSTLTGPAVTTVAVWIVAGWRPGAPKFDADVKSMLGFGGIMTLNGLAVYIAYNLDKVLIGRVLGAESLGLYSRAYQVINIPTGNINAAVGGITFATLSRLQNDPPRFRKYFLKAYSLVNAMTAPITIFSAVFAVDIIRLLLGPQWFNAVPIFQLLTPTVLIFGIINPIGWLLYANGLFYRSMLISFVIAPLLIVAYLLGLPYGATGVAFAFSAAMTLWLVPHVIWCLHGTVVSPKDIFVATLRPVIAALVAVGLAWLVMQGIGHLPNTLLRLTIAGTVMMTAYAVILLFAMGQLEFYLTLFRALFARGEAEAGDDLNDANAVLARK
jgi:PST family polysaccharide transporter